MHADAITQMIEGALTEGTQQVQVARDQSAASAAQNHGGRGPDVWLAQALQNAAGLLNRFPLPHGAWKRDELRRAVAELSRAELLWGPSTDDCLLELRLLNIGTLHLVVNFDPETLYRVLPEAVLALLMQAAVRVVLVRSVATQNEINPAVASALVGNNPRCAEIVDALHDQLAAYNLACWLRAHPTLAPHLNSAGTAYKLHAPRRFTDVPLQFAAEGEVRRIDPLDALMPCVPDLFASVVKALGSNRDASAFARLYYVPAMAAPAPSPSDVLSL